ncbi:MAG: hypothetical protein Q4Q04_00740 [Methanocorpusculum sp.]|nr:hypothetical protein [Methanocorpusculum sp.]
MTELPDWSSEELEKIYLVSRLVARGEIDTEKAAVKLAGILKNRPQSNVIYFSMYAHMINGRVFKQSGGDRMILYFLRRIAQDSGAGTLSRALDAVYGYSGFRGSLGCYVEDLESACAALKYEYGLAGKPK